MNNAVDGTLQNFIDKVKEAGSAERVAKEQTDNLDGDLASLNSAFEETQLTLSEAVTPAIRKCTVWLTKAVDTVGAFAKKHETLLKVLIAVGVSIGGIIAMMASFNMVWGGAGYILMSAVTGALKLWKGLILLKNAILVVKSAMLVFNAVLLANPIMLIIAAIASLIVIGVLLYKNWDLIKEKAAALWSWFSEKCPRLANIFSSAFNGIVTVISTVWNNIKYQFTQIIDFVQNIFAGEWGKAWDNVKNIFVNMFGSLSGLAKAPINGLITLINKTFSAIGSISVSVPDWVPGMGGETFGFELPQIPMLANGGIVTKTTTAMIGEGSEPEAVLPLSKLDNLLSGSEVKTGSSNITINFNPTINVTTNGESGDAYDQVRKALAEGSSNFQKQIEQYFAQRSRLSYE